MRLKLGFSPKSRLSGINLFDSNARSNGSNAALIESRDMAACRFSTAAALSGDRFFAEGMLGSITA